MICNRTQADIDYAKEIRAKLQAGESLTSDEITALNKGSFSIDLLNRVESKQSELAAILNGYAYTVNMENKTDWQSSEIFDFSDHKRLLDNLDKLKKAFFVYKTTPSTPAYMYGYLEANAVEKILVDIERMVDDMVSSFRECGTFKCGEE